MGAVDTTYTFTATDTITSSKMNNIIDQTTITSDAIFGTTLEVASGKLKIRAQGITSNELSSGSVTSNAIADGTIVNANISASADIAGSKLADNSTSGVKLADNSTSGVKLADASVAPAKLSQPLTLSTVKNATGTVVDFTSIPSWVKRITVIFNGVSTTGASLPLIRLGDSGGIEATGYVGTAQWYYAGNGIDVSTVGQPICADPAAAALLSGIVSILLISSNTWVFSGNIVVEGSVVNSCAGKKALSDVLTQIRITTVNGTDTFDAGSINIMYE